MMGKNRVRAIFVGNRKVGKTDLIRALQGKVIRKGDIEITEWPVETNLTAHLWDFSAHVCENGAYRFFLRAGCVYVLVIDAGSPDGNPNQTAEDQLEYLSAFDADARTPVLLVANKWDKTLKEDRYRCLCKDYPNIQGFYPLSSSPEYRDRFVHELAIFETALVEQLRKTAENQPRFSDNQLTVIKALRQASQQDSFLEKHLFDELCRQQGIDEKQREDFLDLLDQSGEIIYLPNLYRLYDFNNYLLNSSWLTHGAHRILHENALRHRHGIGIVHWDEVKLILTHYTTTDEQGNTLSYPEKRLRFFVRVMEEFGIFYPSRDAPNGKWIVPALLPGDRPERLDFEHGGALRFDFRFETSLPRHVFNLFIVEHYTDIHNQQVWQRGIYLKNRIWPDTKALADVDYQAGVLSMEVTGPHVDLYFPELYASVLKILKRIPKLKCKQFLYMNESALIRGKSSGKDAHANFEEFLKGKAAGKYEHVCGLGTYDVQKVLHSTPRDMDRGLDVSIREGTEKKSPTERDSINTIAAVVSAIAGVMTTIITIINSEVFLDLWASDFNPFISGAWASGIKALFGGVAVFLVLWVTLRYILRQLRNIWLRLRRWVSDFRHWFSLISKSLIDK